VVSFLDKNHPACVDLTIAAASLGAANAIINFRLAGDEVDYAVNDSGAKVLIVGTEVMPLVEKIRDRLTTVERVIEVTPRGGPGDEYESVLADATPAARDPDVESSDVCLIMYSSGTTRSRWASTPTWWCCRPIHAPCHRRRSPISKCGRRSWRADRFTRFRTDTSAGMARSIHVRAG
jgi:hypothetical protein